MKIISGWRKRHYLTRVSVFLTIAALIAGIAGCGGGGGGNNLPPSENLEIRTWYDLDNVRNNLNGNHTLTNNLNSTTPGYEELASPTAKQGKGWQPIGTYESQGSELYTGFRGTFDGQGYEIRDLFINRPDEDSIGLFGFVYNDGVIKDIGAVNVTVTGGNGVGGLVGFNHGTVSNCYCSANVTGNKTTGGLAGGSPGTGIVRNCCFTGNVTGTYKVGGLAGNICYGGSVSDSYSNGNVIGLADVGGLVGDNTRGTVSNSYSTGNVSGDEDVGGLVGRNHRGDVSKSYSTGSVIGLDDVGGLVGENEGTVSSSFWDIETSGQATSDGGTGKSTTEMQEITTFSGATWDIVAVANPSIRNSSYIWNMVDDETYPFLSWEL